MPDDLAAHLFNLERSLHTGPTRNDPAAIAALLSDDFREFGSSGRIWSKSEVIAELPAETPSLITTRDYACQSLSPGLALVTYISYNGKREALRSSVWRLEEGDWRMVFHQGTLIPA